MILCQKKVLELLKIFVSIEKSSSILRCSEALLHYYYIIVTLFFPGTVRHYYTIITLLLHYHYIIITLSLFYYYIIITILLHYYYHIIIPRYSEAGDLRLSGSLHVHLLSGQNNEDEDNCHYHYIIVTFYPVKL